MSDIVSLGEQPHDPTGCLFDGQPHLGPCENSAPVPLPLYLNDDGQYEVLDGKQRAPGKLPSRKR